MLNPIRKALRNATMGAVVSLIAGGAAQATVVGGIFDPAFGFPLTGVNYSGEAFFNISDKCLSPTHVPLADATGVFVYSSNHCGGTNPSQMSFIGAHVDFTDNHNNVIGQLDFTVGTILGMFLQNHTVVGVQSDLIGPATVVGGVLNGDQFELVFGDPAAHHDGNEPLQPQRGDGDHDYDDQVASFFEKTHLILVGGSACNSGGCPSTSQAATTTYHIPEPGSLGLALGALGAGWIARRKKPGAPIAPTA